MPLRKCLAATLMPENKKLYSLLFTQIPHFHILKVAKAICEESWCLREAQEEAATFLGLVFDGLRHYRPLRMFWALLPTRW